jgi:hypothetical protein
MYSATVTGQYLKIGSVFTVPTLFLLDTTFKLEWEFRYVRIVKRSEHQDYIQYAFHTVIANSRCLGCMDKVFF